jgi:hypothetical protein
MNKLGITKSISCQPQPSNQRANLVQNEFDITCVPPSTYAFRTKTLSVAHLLRMQHGTLS